MSNLLKKECEDELLQIIVTLTITFSLLFLVKICIKLLKHYRFFKLWNKHMHPKHENIANETIQMPYCTVLNESTPTIRRATSEKSFSAATHNPPQLTQSLQNIRLSPPTIRRPVIIKNQANYATIDENGIFVV